MPSTACARITADAKIDRLASPGLAQGAIEQAQGLDPPRQPIKPDAGGIVGDAARFDADQRGDHLKIVLHAMLKLAKLDVLLLNPLLDIARIDGVAAEDLDERHQPEDRGPAVVLDQVRPGVDRPGVALERDGEGADVVPLLGHRGAQGAGVLGVGGAGQQVPEAPDDFGRRLPGQALELHVGVDDALDRVEFGDGDGHRNLVQELLELVAFERNRQVGRVEQLFNAVRLGVIGRHV
jgi:hypothetical protein